MNTTAQNFAVITSRPTPYPTAKDDYRPHFQTCGHASERCPAIKSDSTIIGYDATLAEFLEGNEFFDGEIVYAAPFRCQVCHADLCNGGECQDILRLCSKHSDQYQRRYGRAANE